MADAAPPSSAAPPGEKRRGRTPAQASVPPVLELEDAFPDFETSVLPNAKLRLRLCPGECVLVETHDPERATALADLCSGMVPLIGGTVRFMGYDWDELDEERRLALRGRIGRIHQRAPWPGLLRTHLNVMLPLLHHTREPVAEIARNALELAQHVGLPGLPLVRPDRLGESDLVRAACVRAFLGEPQLLLLEGGAVATEHAELVPSILDLLLRALDRGAAALCFTRDLPLWRQQRFPLSQRLHLLEDGLIPMRNA